MANAVVLAGTHADRNELVNGMNKALLKINNRRVLEYIIDALDKSKLIDKIVAVGPKYTLDNIIEGNRYRKNIITVEESYSKEDWKRMLENMENGYRYVNCNNEHVLYLPGDIPLVMDRHIDAFVESCYAYEMNVMNNDFYYNIVDNDASRKRWMHERPGFRIKENNEYRNYRLGNMSFVNPEKIGNKELLARCFNSSRKILRLISKLKLMTDVGLGATLDTMIRYYTKGLSFDDVEKYVSKALNTRLKLIKSDYVESEYDIDNEYDYENIKRIIMQRDRLKTFRSS